MKTGAIILAAGYSSRMGGGFKPLMRLGKRSLLAHCAELFRQAGVDRITVVTGYRRLEVEEEAAQFGLHCHYNADFERGMFSSLQSAVHHFTGCDGFFLLPVDIPLLRPAVLKEMLSVFDGDSVLLPAFKGRCGHPPLVPASFIRSILKYPGRNGLQGLIDENRTQKVAVWDRGILLDCDTHENFEVLKRREAIMDIGEPVEAAVLAGQSMPLRGVNHGRAVARAAVALTRELNRHGASLSPALVHNGALLHDIAKGHPDHEAKGAEMVKELGLTGVADLIGRHKDLAPPEDGTLYECEIVCLADKLVRGTRRVSIRSRFEEKLKLYGMDPAARKAICGRMANALALQSLFEKITGRTAETVLDSSMKP